MTALSAWCIVGLGCAHPVCISPGALSSQLIELSAQTSTQILFGYREVQGLTAGVCPGPQVTTNTALRELLAGTPYTWDWVNANTVAVVPLGVPCDPDRGANAPVPPCRNEVAP